MELNRNQYFFAGVLLVLIGVQLRMVASYVLTPETTRIMAKQTQSTAEAVPTQFAFGVAEAIPAVPAPRKVIRPPEWLGWCLLSVGAVLVLHSLSMRKPE